MNTDNFNYGTRGRYIKVVAKLNQTVKMVKNYIELSQVRMNFTYDKQQPENGTWRFAGKGICNFVICRMSQQKVYAFGKLWDKKYEADIQN